MKHVIAAIVVGGLLAVAAIVPAEAASGRGGGFRGGGSGWQGGAPRGGTQFHGGGRWGGRGFHGSKGWRGGAPLGGARFHGGSGKWYGRGSHGGTKWYGSPRVFIGGGFGWWGWPGWWGPTWWGGGWYPSYAAPPVVAPSVPEYIEPAPQGYWYYCQSAGAYYPYVTDCPGGWIQVVPQPAPPGQ